jgi:hypothetical protein
MKNTTPLALLTVFAALLSGCAAPPVKEETPPPAPVVQPKEAPPPEVAPPVVVEPPAPAPIEPSLSEKKLSAAIAAYERGEYPAAIRQLTPLTTDSTLDTPAQLRALKALAFSQCVSRAVMACRKSFERAFHLDAKFELAPAERGHPLWWPEFERARKAAANAKRK